MTPRPQLDLLLDAAQKFADAYGPTATYPLVPVQGGAVDLLRLATELHDLVDRSDAYQRMAATLAHTTAALKLAQAKTSTGWREVVFSDGFRHRVADGVHEFFNTMQGEWCVIEYTQDYDAEHFIELRENPRGEQLDVLRAIRDEISAVVMHAEFGSPESVRAMTANTARDIVGFVKDSA